MDYIFNQICLILRPFTDWPINDSTAIFMCYELEKGGICGNPPVVTEEWISILAWKHDVNNTNHAWRFVIRPGRLSYFDDEGFEWEI